MEVLQIFIRANERLSSQIKFKIIETGEHKFIYVEGKSEAKTADSIVFLHGFGVDKDRWVQMARYMKGYHLAIPDTPGYGDSRYIVSFINQKK